MYLSRTGSLVDILMWLGICGMWWAGGWLVSMHVFRLRSRENFFAGGASGLILFILLGNAIAFFVPLETAFWLAAVSILLIGLGIAHFSDIRPRLPLGSALQPAPLVIFVFTLAVLFLINRGLGIWDDYHNLPIVSTIAAGQIPPRFYLNPDLPLDYHYGLHIFAASLVRMGGFYPWSAFDAAKSLSSALTLILAWSWFRRFTKESLALTVGVLLVFFAAGSRWMLLFIPESMLEWISTGIVLQGSAMQTASDLYSTLTSSWNIQGDGPFPFPFAFASGVFSPLSLALAGSGAMPEMTLFLLLLLAKRTWRPLAGIASGLILASLALTGEHWLLMFWGGIFLAVMIGLISRPGATSKRSAFSWVWVLMPSLLLAPVMGGMLTEIFNLGMNKLRGRTISTSLVSTPGLGLRWPPAFLSAHFGELAFNDPGQVLVAVLEMGPVLLLAPFGVCLTWRYLRGGKWFEAGLGIAAWVGFLAPIIFKFHQRDRDLARLTASACFIWLIMGMPYLWLALRRGRKTTRIFISAGIVITLISGIALFPPQLIAIARAQPAPFVQNPDALMAAKYWDQLEAGALVLDLGTIQRAPTLFGRTTGSAHMNVYIRLPKFEQLMANPDPKQFADAGYDYLYLGKRSWQNLTEEQTKTFRHPCVIIVEEQRTEMNDFRRLLDIQQCRGIR